MLVPKLESGRKEGKIGPADLQRLSILVVYPGEIKDDLQPISDAIRLAAELGVPEVAVDGEPVESARRHLSIQGLLNVLEPAAAEKLLGEAARAKVRLSYRYEDDPESAAHTIWAGLFSARALGLNAAKYGLTPLVLDQQRYVIEHVQRWMKGWTAIPAFYIDIPLVTSDTVYQSDRCVEAAQRWLKMASSAGAKVVLIDAPDRIKPRRLLKATGKNDDIGVLNLEQAKQLNEYAEKLGLRVLWAGGIHADQAFQLAKLGVFGIFTTTSTAKPACRGRIGQRSADGCQRVNPRCRVFAKSMRWSKPDFCVTCSAGTANFPRRSRSLQRSFFQLRLRMRNWNQNCRRSMN